MIDKSASQNAWKDLTGLTILSTDRVSGLFCPEAGHCKSAIRRSFPDVFGLFGPFKVGKIYPPKKFRFQRWLKLTYFLIYEFWGLPTLECQFEQILEYNITFFEDEISELFFILMAQKYQYEISPTFIGPSKLSTALGKHLRMADL